jgi:hypothetical protein
VARHDDGDTFWSQYTNTPTTTADSTVTVDDLAPAGDRWDMVAVELIGDDS